MPLCVPVAPAQEGGSVLRSADKTPLRTLESRGEGGELPRVWVLSAGTTGVTFILRALCFACSHPGTLDRPASWFFFRLPALCGSMVTCGVVTNRCVQHSLRKKSFWLVCWFPSHMTSQRAELGWVPACRQGRWHLLIVAPEGWEASR